MASALEGLGCVVIGPATSLGETLRLALDERELDAAVLDVNLRGMEVWPASDILAARGIRHLFTTGYGERVEAAGALVLEKPFTVPRLEAAMKSLFETVSRPAGPRPVTPVPVPSLGS